MNSGKVMVIPPAAGVKLRAVSGSAKAMLIAGVPFGVIVNVPKFEMSPSTTCSMSFLNVSMLLSNDSIVAYQLLIDNVEFADVVIAQSLAWVVGKFALLMPVPLISTLAAIVMVSSHFTMPSVGAGSLIFWI